MDHHHHDVGHSFGSSSDNSFNISSHNHNLPHSSYSINPYNGMLTYNPTGLPLLPPNNSANFPHNSVSLFSNNSFNHKHNRHIGNLDPYIQPNLNYQLNSNNQSNSNCIGNVTLASVILIIMLLLAPLVIMLIIVIIWIYMVRKII